MTGEDTNVTLDVIDNDSDIQGNDLMAPMVKGCCLNSEMSFNPTGNYNVQSVFSFWWHR